MPRKKQEPTGRMDFIYAQMEPALKAEFEDLCRWRPAITEIERWLNSHGFDPSYSQIHHWYRKYYKPGTHAIAIAKSIGEYEGLDARSVAALAMASSAKILSEYLELICNKKTIQIVLETDPKAALGLLPGLLREARSAAQQYHQMIATESRQDLILSGANALAEDLKITFKDTAFESALVDGITGGLLKIEGK